ncbi:hypothetical protein J0H58_22965 [bacterium]|nr:hypothetical protein [bacterium]
MTQPSAHGTLLRLDALESRDVPSAAATLDLTLRGSGGEINEGLFRQFDARPTGTGKIDSFVRVQALGNKSVEEGYNTDARPLQFDENKSPQFTRSMRVADLPLVNVGGVLYREVLLDINQKASASQLSLDALKVFVGGTGNLTGYDAATGTLAGLAPVYDLDAGGDHWVKLDARLNTGSGSGDMLFYVPADAVGSDGYLYLYSKFGATIAANGGFEEWAAGVGGESVSGQAAAFSGTVFSPGEEGSGVTPISGGILQLFLNGDLVDEVEVGFDGTFAFNNVLLEDAEVTFTLAYIGTNPNDPGLADVSSVITLFAGETRTDVMLYLADV